MFLGRRIFEGKLSVSPYFLHYYQDNNEAGMLLVDILSQKTPGVHLFGQRPRKGRSPVEHRGTFVFPA